MAAFAVCAGAIAAAGARAADDIEFDLSAYEKRPFEWNGYLELKPEHQWLDRDAALYGLQFPGEARSTQTRTAAAAELSAVYRRGDTRLHVTAHGSYLDDARGAASDLQFYEAYAAWQATPRAAAEIGKRTLRWGKGYAFNPVAFFERAKDPTDPELAREGFVVATGNWVRSFTGPLTTLSFTPVLLPVDGSVNDDYGPGNHWNAGAKLYALAYDTDVDLLYASSGSRGARWGVDFSRNLGSNFEIHGEWARSTGVHRVVLTPADTLETRERSFISYLLGLRYLTAQQTTIIVELYRNGGGYTEAEARRFFSLAQAVAANLALRPVAVRAAGSGYAGPNPMRRYVYLRLAQPEPFDILYFAAALTAIINAEDGSHTLIPEVTYTRINNLELRLRLQFNRGDRLSDFGEKAVDTRAELRMRLFF